MRTTYYWLTNRPGWLLGAASAIYLLLGLGQDGINLDSATYAVIARNMAELGQWFNPHYTNYYHSAFAEHPPLVMWLQGLVFLLVTPNDSTARIVGAVCTLGSVLAVYHIGREIMGKSYGFLCGLTLLLTYNFMQIGNSTLLDVPMTFFILLVLLGLTKMLKRGLTVPCAIFTGMALGCAWLAKGVVSGPIWLALILTCLLLGRQWLAKKEFWLIPVVAIAMITAHLILDIVFAGGRFTGYYFFEQVYKRFLGGGPEIDTKWWEFSYRFVKLYLPFIVLFPFGIIIAIKKRHVCLYPVLLTFLFYAIFLSFAAKLYYHYFCPVYALAALITALPLFKFLSEKQVKGIMVGFFILWVIAAAGIRVADIRVHEIRTSEIYTLNDSMSLLLDNSPSRDGVSVGTPPPNWDHIAKAGWYWRSDIRQVGTAREAVQLLDSAGYAYLIVEKSNPTAMGQIEAEYAGVLRESLSNDKVIIFTLARHHTTE